MVLLTAFLNLRLFNELDSLLDPTVKSPPTPLEKSKLGFTLKFTPVVGATDEVLAPRGALFVLGI